MHHVETAGSTEVSKIVIQDVKLKTVNIKKKVTFCSIKGCPNISHLSGFGEFLKLDQISSKSRIH